MKKVGYIIGSLELILGLISLVIINITNQVLQNIAYISNLSNTNNLVKSDFSIKTGLPNGIAIVLCLLGIINILYFAFVDNNKSKN